MSMLETRAIEGSIDVLREASDEQVVQFADFYAWQCGTRAEADMRIEQAIMNLQRIQQVMRQNAKKRANDTVKVFIEE